MGFHRRLASLLQLLFGGGRGGVRLGGSNRPAAWLGGRERAEVPPREPMPLHQGADVLGSDSSVQGDFLDAPLVAAQQREEVEAFEHPEGTSPGGAEGKAHVLRRESPPSGMRAKDEVGNLDN